MRYLPLTMLFVGLCCISGCGGCSKEKGSPDGQAALGQPQPTRADDAAYVESLKEMGAQKRKAAAAVAAATAALDKAKEDAATAPEEIKRLEGELEAAKAAQKDDLKASRAKILARIKADAKNENNLKEQKK